MVLTVQAPAKINLTLEVLGRRPDGYHDLVSVMQTLDLCDEIVFAPAADLIFSCSDPALAGEGNLVLRAARLLPEAAGVRSGASITLTKRIPHAAGLGGGSSDAAWTLRALNYLWGLHLPLERLDKLAARLGSDVPFFLRGGACLAEGRGERLTPLPDLPRRPVVLLKPPLAVPTAAVYRAATPADYADGARSRALIAALEAGRPPDPDLFFNSLEAVALRLHPEIETYAAAFRRAGAPWVRLSGSGPTLFTLPDSEIEAAELAARLSAEGHEAYLCHTLGRVDVPA